MNKLFYTVKYEWSVYYENNKQNPNSCHTNLNMLYRYISRIKLFYNEIRDVQNI